MNVKVSYNTHSVRWERNFLLIQLRNSSQRLSIRAINRSKVQFEQVNVVVGACHTLFGLFSLLTFTLFDL